MKKFLFPILMLLFSVSLGWSQANWSNDIAPILYKNCTSCHNPNGVGGFSLMDYSGAKQRSSSIGYKVMTGQMPPWTTDTTYQRFVHERILTPNERNKIVDWANNGAPSGDLSQAPAPPVYPVGAILGTPDLSVQMPVYTSKATASKDDYICIVLPSGLTKDRKIKAVEVVPGNRNIVHHTLVFLDPTRQYQSDTVGGDCGGPTSGFMVTAYAPGGAPTIFPNGNSFKTGITMPANSNVILAMHYPEGSAGLKDSTSVNFFFYDENETGIREISTNRLLENWNFCIPPNSLKTVEDWYPSKNGNGTNQDYSLLSIFPHMHLLGKSITSYGLDSNNDTIPLVNIPHWDFDWQDFYFFKKIQKLPQGSKLYGKAIYDNRSSNPHNPFNPPQTVCAGLNTTNEMFLFYFHYMPYQPGDENINLDSLMQVGLSVHNYNTPGENAVKVYPNPFSRSVHIEYTLKDHNYVNLFIYDATGKLVKRLQSGMQDKGTHKVDWNGSNNLDSRSPSGIYFYSLKVGETLQSGKLILD